MDKKGEIQEYLKEIFILLGIIIALYLLYTFITGRISKIV